MNHKFKQTQIGKIPEEWGIVALKDVAIVNELVIDKPFHFEKIEYIDISSVSQGQITEIQSLSIQDAPSRAQRIVRDNDILLSTVRPNLKHFAFIMKATPDMIASTGFAVISAKRIDPQFLYYYLTTDRYTEYLSAIADTHTSTYPACNPDVIENSSIPLPSLPAQRAIAKILSDLDEKIELNRQMNKTLESNAQAIFKHWFVDFEFSSEDGKPYKSGGGEMVESDLGAIPQGWHFGSILDIADLLSGGTPRTEVREFWNGDVPWVSARDVTAANGTYIIDTEKSITEAGVENSNAKVLAKNTTVISARGTVGNCCILGRDMAINQTNYGLKAKNGNWDMFVFFTVSNGISQMKQRAYGTVFDTITTRSFQELTTPIPPLFLIEHFARIVGAHMTDILNHLEEKRNLQQIRDSLLPRLMSGKIRTKEKKWS